MSSPVSQSFRNRANDASFWEAWVATVLSRAGLWVLKWPFDISDRDHSLDADLTVYRYHPGGHQVATLQRASLELEVKSRSISFNTPEDYPYDRVKVCSHNSMRRKWPQDALGLYRVGRSFLFVSTLTGAILWLPEGSAVTGPHDWYDSTRDEHLKGMECAKHQLRPLGDFIETFKDR